MPPPYIQQQKPTFSRTKKKKAFWSSSSKTVVVCVRSDQDCEVVFRVFKWFSRCLCSSPLPLHRWVASVWANGSSFGNPIEIGGSFPVAECPVSQGTPRMSSGRAPRGTVCASIIPRLATTLYTNFPQAVRLEFSLLTVTVLEQAICCAPKSLFVFALSKYLLSTSPCVRLRSFLTRQIWCSSV